jgi:hypothetical protein
MTPDITMCGVALRDVVFYCDPSDWAINATARVMDLPLNTGDQTIHRFEAGLPRRTARLAR